MAYEVKGSNLSELKAEMANHGPLDQFGTHRFALTSWDLKWSWGNQGGALNLRRPVIQASADIYLPRWTNAEKASLHDREAWFKFYANILRHELNHLRGFESFSRRLPSEFEHAASQKISSEVEADRLMHKLAASAHSFDRAYDLRTEHGKSEGVTLD